MAISNTRLVQDKIKEIGKRGFCLDEELAFFLGDLPTIHGSEFIFTISWANASKYIDTQVEFFIKGLHLIETKYKIYANHNFGFGSPSPTYKVISILEAKDAILAAELTKWVLENGGNYYIK